MPLWFVALLPKYLLTTSKLWFLSCILVSRHNHVLGFLSVCY
jgi:hypothetical protein